MVAIRLAPFWNSFLTLASLCVLGIVVEAHHICNTVKIIFWLPPWSCLPLLIASPCSLLRLIRSPFISVRSLHSLFFHSHFLAEIWVLWLLFWILCYFLLSTAAIPCKFIIQFSLSMHTNDKHDLASNKAQNENSVKTKNFNF